MAPSRYFDKNSPIVRLSCSDDDEPFNVHADLFIDNTLFQEMKLRGKGPFTIKVDGTEEGLRRFVDYLYHDEPITTRFARLHEHEGGISHHALVVLLEAHEVGRKLSAFNLMDTVLDAIIHALVEDCSFCPHLFIKAFAKEFPPHCGGWKFAVDVLFNSCKPTCHGNGCAEVFDLENVDDSALVIELASRIANTKGVKLPEGDGKLEFSKWIVNGFLDTVKREGRTQPEDRFWALPRCHYHSHKAMAFPCYKSMPDPGTPAHQKYLERVKRRREELENEESRDFDELSELDEPDEAYDSDK